MGFQRAVTLEDLVAETNRRAFRVIRPQNFTSVSQKHNPHFDAPVQDIAVKVACHNARVRQETSDDERKMVTLTDKEIAFNWLMRHLSTRRQTLMCEKSLFGTVTFEVPVEECNPSLIEEILVANKVPMLRQEGRYNLKTGKKISVVITCNTPEVGLLNTL